MVRVILVLAALCIAQVGAQFPDIATIEPDLTVPGLSEGKPGPGKRVKVTLPGYEGTRVYHVLYLPTDWHPARKYPVLVEYAGNGPYRNRYGDISTGLVEGSRMGYGISAGKGYLWLCLPYLNGEGTVNVRSWWGSKPGHDPLPTVNYCLEAVKLVCASYGGDREQLVLCGFSRGAIACNLLAALNYHRDPNGLPVFYLLSLICLAIWLGVGFDDLVRKLGRFGRPAFLVPLCAMAVGLVLANHYAESDRSENWIAERYGRDILADLPADAVLIAEGDDAAYVLDYLQRIEKVRPDVSLYNRVGRGMDLLDWDEHDMPPREQRKLRKRREGELARSGRPLFYLVPRRAPLDGWEFTPKGLLYRLQPISTNPATGQVQIEMANAMVEGLFRDAWVRKIQSNYWFMSGEDLMRAADSTGAIAAYQQAARVAYDSRTTRFNVALEFYKNDILEDAMLHAQAAAEIDPWKADPYQLMAHIRRKQGRNGEARELLKKAGELR